MSGYSLLVYSRHSIYDPNDGHSLFLLPFHSVLIMSFTATRTFTGIYPVPILLNSTRPSLYPPRPGTAPGILWVCNKYLQTEGEYKGRKEEKNKKVSSLRFEKYSDPKYTFE